MDKTLSTLIWIGVIAWAFWFFFIRKNRNYNLPVYNPSSNVPITRPTDTSSPVEEVADAISVQPTIGGFRRVCLPVDIYGNIVVPHLASKIICLDNVNDNCQLTYGNRVYVLRLRHHHEPPPPAPEPAP